LEGDRNHEALIVGEPAAGGREEVHGRGDVQIPQLELLRPNLEGLPEVRLPEDYTLRHYRPGDEEVWGEIMSEAFTPYWNAKRFRMLLLPHFGFGPERVLFVCREGRPIGSASAFQWPGIPRDRGYIHMVGVKKEHCGRRLGYWLTVACLEKFREQGFGAAMLQTEDFRIPAIKHYLRLGFRPVLVIPEQREKWTGLLKRIGGEDLVREMGIGDLPVMNGFYYQWRSMLLATYQRWLNLKYELRGKGD
jgi:mycothiol synthase